MTFLKNVLNFPKWSCALNFCIGFTGVFVLNVETNSDKDMDLKSFFFSIKMLSIVIFKNNSYLRIVKHVLRTKI